MKTGEPIDLSRFARALHEVAHSSADLTGKRKTTAIVDELPPSVKISSANSMNIKTMKTMTTTSVRTIGASSVAQVRCDKCPRDALAGEPVDFWDWPTVITLNNFKYKSLSNWARFGVVDSLFTGDPQSSLNAREAGFMSGKRRSSQSVPGRRRDSRPVPCRAVGCQTRAPPQPLPRFEPVPCPAKRNRTR